MTATPLELLLSKLPNVKKSRKGWSAQCPAHEDRKPSLSITEGDDGRALVKCHAGCTAKEVCSAVGLKLADLMPADSLAVSTPTQSRRTSKSGQSRRRDSGKPAKTYKTGKRAIQALERKHGKRSAFWTYHNADGEPVGVIARWDTAAGKEIRPVARCGDRWTIGGMPEPRPLYRLPDLASADRVYITEGEKAAEAARAIGLAATTSAHGSQCADKTDWSPLAGKECVILPDHDEPGREYADTVAAILAQLTPPAVVRVVELPDLPDHGDMADWVEAGGTEQQFRELVKATPTWTPATGQPWPEIVWFDELKLPEFPTAALPSLLREWVWEESYATQTPPALAGLLALAVCAAAIARRVVVSPRGGWREPVNLFVAVLLEPGNRKSAVFNDALGPLRKRENELIEGAKPVIARKKSTRRQYDLRLQKLEKQAAAKYDAKLQAQATDLAAEGANYTEPVLPRLIVDDATSEKIGMMLAAQSGRIASMSPEGGVFDLMAGLYSKSGIPQFDVYLKGHSGDELVTDRVSREPVRVKRPALTCAYTIQRSVIENLMVNKAFRGRGLLARFLYAIPPSWIGHREIATTPVSESVRQAYENTVQQLSELDCQRELPLTAEASRVFRDWEAEIEAMLADGGQMEAMRDWGAKLAGATLRMATVMHSVEHGADGSIDQPIIASAIEIARYLIPHADAVLRMMDLKEDAGDENARYVLRWIERHKHQAFTKRDAQQHGKRRFPTADDIDSALTELQRRGYIRSRPVEKTRRGRPPSPMYDVNPAIFEKSEGEKRSQYSQNSAEQPEGGISENIENDSGQSETAQREQVTV